jgi:hypothetical protein
VGVYLRLEATPVAINDYCGDVTNGLKTLQDKTDWVEEEAPSSPQALFGFFRAALAAVFSATASRMSAFNAFSSILSP